MRHALFLAGDAMRHTRGDAMRHALSLAGDAMRHPPDSRLRYQGPQALYPGSTHYSMVRSHFYAMVKRP